MMLNPETLRIVRKTCGATQERLGKLLGVTGQYIAMIERGKRPLTPQLERRIRRALNLDDDRLAEIIEIYNRYNIEAKTKTKAI